MAAGRNSEFQGWWWARIHIVLSLSLSFNDGGILQCKLTLYVTGFNMQLAQEPGNPKEEPTETGIAVDLAADPHHPVEPADKRQAKG